MEYQNVLRISEEVSSQNSQNERPDLNETSNNSPTTLSANVSPRLTHTNLNR